MVTFRQMAIIVDINRKSRRPIEFEQKRLMWVGATAAEITDAGSIHGFDARTVYISVSMRAGKKVN